MADCAFEMDNTRGQKLSGMITYVPKAISANIDIDDVAIKRRNENDVPYKAAALDTKYTGRFDDKTYYTT